MSTLQKGACQGIFKKNHWNKNKAEFSVLKENSSMYTILEITGKLSFANKIP